MSEIGGNLFPIVPVIKSNVTQNIISSGHTMQFSNCAQYCTLRAFRPCPVEVCKRLQAHVLWLSTFERNFLRFQLILNTVDENIRLYRSFLDRSRKL